MHLPFHINALAFDPAIHHNTKAAFTFEKPTHLTSKCPFSSLTNWLKAPSATDNSSKFGKASSVAYAKIMETNELPVHDASIKMGHTISSKQSISHKWTHKYRIRVEKAYRNALSLRCPFFRRRATDVLEFTDSTIRQLMGNSAASLGPAIALRGIDNGGEKLIGLSISDLAEILRKDWREDNNKGYYVTGRLTANVYRDDCLFDGPDPDMPVRGIRKYMNAASQLFEYKSTTSELLSLRIHEGTVVARWRFIGTMRLPWKPKLPAFTGTTVYFTDSSGLIHKHIETWDISVLQAFIQVFFPRMSQILWPTKSLED